MSNYLGYLLGISYEFIIYSCYKQLVSYLYLENDAKTCLI